MARKIWKIGWRLAVCALLMSWILHAIFQNEGRLAWERQGHSWSQLSRTQQWQAAWSHGTRELWNTLRLVDPIALLLSVLFVGLTILLGVVRWRMVLRVHGIDLALGRTAEISLVAHFFNSFLLGSTGGDLLKAYYAARETHHKKTEAVVTVAVDRLLGLFAMLLFACAMMLPNLALLQAHKRLAALAVFVLLMTIGCGLAIGLSFWGGVSRLWPKSRAWLRNLPKGELLEQCLDACREFGRRRGFILRTLGLSMLLNMVGVFQILALARGLNLNIPPVALFAMVPMITCVSALPITPSGLGVRENLYVLMLAAPEIHVPATSALSLSLLAYAGNLFWSLIGSIVYATLKERHHLAEVVQAGAAAGVNGKPPLESPGRKFFMRPIAIEIVRGLQAAGHQAYFVGGCVRDQWLGLEPQDYDIATSAMPEQIESLFPRTVSVGRQFGVVVVIEQGTPFQVATFRAEADYRDGRHPSRVTFCDPRADALRRDFTVNGLFWDPLQNRLHDWVGGEADLRAKIIRTIGDPRERFDEDHLRLLRAVRFAAQLSFGIEPATFAAVRAKAPKILEVSAERIREELLKLFRPPHAARGLDLLRESGLLQQVLPEVAATIPCEQSRDFHPEGTVYNHLIRIFEHLPADAAPSLIWSALLHDIGKPATASRDPQTGAIHFFGHEAAGAEIANKILQRLRFPRKQTDEIVACVRQHMQFKDVLQMRKSTLRRMLLRPTFPIERELHRLDCLGSHGRLDHYEFLVGQAEQLERQPAIRPPLLTGNDLLGMGMKPGPIMGRLLAELREKQLQDELKTPDEARAWARKQLGET